jgi:hypothetical protein
MLARGACKAAGALRTVQALSSLFLGISPNLYALVRAGGGRTQMRTARHGHMQGLQGWRMRVCKGAGRLFLPLNAGLGRAARSCSSKRYVVWIDDAEGEPWKHNWIIVD